MQSVLAITPLSPPLFDGGVTAPSEPEGAFLASFEAEGNQPADLAAEPAPALPLAMPLTLAAAVPLAPALEGDLAAAGQEVGTRAVGRAGADSGDLATDTPVAMAANGGQTAKPGIAVAPQDIGRVAGVALEELAEPGRAGAAEVGQARDGGPVAQGLAQRSGVAAAARAAVVSHLPGQAVSTAARLTAAGRAAGADAEAAPSEGDGGIQRTEGPARLDAAARPVDSLVRHAGDEKAPRSDRPAEPGQPQEARADAPVAADRPAAAGRPDASEGQRGTSTAAVAAPHRPAPEPVEPTVLAPERGTAAVGPAKPAPGPEQPVAPSQGAETTIDRPPIPSGSEPVAEVTKIPATTGNLVAPTPGAGFWERIFPSLAIPLSLPAAQPLTPGTQTASDGGTPDSGGDPEPAPTIAAPEMRASAEPARPVVQAAASAPLPTAALPDAAAGLSLDADPLLDPVAEDALAVLTGPVGQPAATSSAAPGLAASLSAPQVAAQITAALTRSADGVTELALSPEELGNVRLRLEPDAANPDRMVVMITFERPETLDLFRRHAGDLAEALRAAGYAGADIGFGQEGSGAGGFDRAPDRGAAPDRLDHAPPIPPAPRLAAGASLDLRL